MPQQEPPQPLRGELLAEQHNKQLVPQDDQMQSMVLDQQSKKRKMQERAQDHELHDEAMYMNPVDQQNKNHILQDHQMQLKYLEQEKKKRKLDLQQGGKAPEQENENFQMMWNDCAEKGQRRRMNLLNSVSPERGEGNYYERQESRSRSESTGEEVRPNEPKFPLSQGSHPPPSGYDLDRLSYHIDLQNFGKGLQDAANAVFSSDRRSRYTQVSVILLSWEDEDPQLPVSLEISALKSVLVDLYGFDVEEYQIPATNSHLELNSRILNFLKDSDTKHLKIVYYAGHGKLSNHGQALWTSHRTSLQERAPTVKWSGIQNACEESQSDVLILLDCCASGMSNTDEGNGVTELIAACAFNDTANGVGSFSFTHTLISQLKKLAPLPSFTVGYLYNLLFTEVQGWRVEDPRHKKVPVHLVLTQNHRLPRSITIPANRTQTQTCIQSPISISEHFPQNASYAPEGINPWNNNGTSDTQPSYSSESPFPSGGITSPSSDDGASSATSASPLPEYPRLLFCVRLREDIKPKKLSADLFADWLGTLPIDAKSIRIEAGFASDSTLLMLSMPIALLAYLPKDPAITMLGTARSRNLVTADEGKGCSASKAEVLTGTRESCDCCGTLEVKCIATDGSNRNPCSSENSQYQFNGGWKRPKLEPQNMQEMGNKYHLVELENSQLRSRLKELERPYQSHKLAQVKAEPGENRALSPLSTYSQHHWQQLTPQAYTITVNQPPTASHHTSRLENTIEQLQEMKGSECNTANIAWSETPIIVKKGDEIDLRTRTEKELREKIRETRETHLKVSKEHVDTMDRVIDKVKELQLERTSLRKHISLLDSQLEGYKNQSKTYSLAKPACDINSSTDKQAMIDDHKDGAAMPGSDLPNGPCRYILSHGCECIGFNIDQSQPESTCNCGHLASYHTPDKVGAVSAEKGELDRLRFKVKLLEKQCAEEKIKLLEKKSDRDKRGTKAVFGILFYVAISSETRFCKPGK